MRVRQAPRAAMAPGYWLSQIVQFPTEGWPGISYHRGELGLGRHVDCLLWRDTTGRLRGILYHYPTDVEFEKAHNVTVLVDPAWQRHGIATELLEEAMGTWPIDLDRQNYTDDGRAFIAQFQANR